MNIKEILQVTGVIGLMLLIILIIILPILAIFMLGDYTATHYLHLQGLVYWAYILIFYIIVAGIIGALSRLGK